MAPADDGAVIVDVHAAGVAFPDALLTRGHYQYQANRTAKGKVVLSVR